jgi:hypothetical protein
MAALFVSVGIVNILQYLLHQVTKVTKHGRRCAITLQGWWHYHKGLGDQQNLFPRLMPMGRFELPIPGASVNNFQELQRY